MSMEHRQEHIRTGAELRTLREQCGFTLEHAARLLEIRATTLEAIEDNRNGSHADPALEFKIRELYGLHRQTSLSVTVNAGDPVEIAISAKDMAALAEAGTKKTLVVRWWPKGKAGKVRIEAPLAFAVKRAAGATS